MMQPSLSPTEPFHAVTARLFWGCFAGTLVLKLALAATVPLTGDEAYFALWGLHPDWGYYDHPPMVGWWLWLVQLFGSDPWLLRLPAILTPLAVAVLLRRVLWPLDPPKADYAATLFLVSPFNLLVVLTTTDTPLVFFSALAAVFAYRAYERDRWPDYLLAGLFLGGAFLSKYFAVLLGLAFAVLFLFFARGRPRIGGLLLLFAGVLPAAAINIAWNYEHGWTNILFNAFNRHEKSGLSLLKPLAFLGITALWLGPGLLWFGLRKRNPERNPFGRTWRELRASGLVTFLIAALVPGAVFFALSPFANVGVHWLFSFFPFVFPVLFAAFSVRGLEQMLRPTAIFSLVPLLIVLGAVQLPVDWMRWHRSYPSIVLAADTGAVLAALRDHREDFLVATSSYTKSAVFTVFTGEHVPVVGPGSYNGRHDDMLTDFRALEGRDIVILTDREAKATAGLGWFQEAEVVSLEVRGAKFPTLVGRGFDYQAYRRDVLQRVTDRYYRYPAWFLPLVKRCFFWERYDLRPSPAPPDQP